jgi:lipopolysaccharide transport system permease protein
MVIDNEDKKEAWDLEIKPVRSLLEINLKEVWKYKDLLFLFVKRDITVVYKQTVLGPLWFFIQPLLTSLTFFLVFGKIANLSTDGVPKILFYFSGIVLWSFFSLCVSSTANTFIANANIFGKVYFPRLITPLSLILSNIVKFSIQLIPFLAIWIYFLMKGSIHTTNYIYLFPILILQTSLLSLGLGLTISALTTKYRDFTFLITFGLQLLMYACSVIYPLSKAPEKYKFILELNPMTWIIETFRYGFLGSGYMDFNGILYSWIVTLVMLLTGILLFNKVERNFMDTV